MFSFDDELDDLETQGMLRSLRTIESGQDRRITIGGRQVLNLCSNNYLGLANDERLKEAAMAAVYKYGVGSGASRLVCGTMELHYQLEERLAAFKKTEACLVFNSGYQANLGLISALVGRGDTVFCDRLSHASIIDGVIVSRAELLRYPHRDTAFLSECLKKNNYRGKKLIVTDSVFSMDGDIAPLKELIELAERYNCTLMIDEAHATGVLGENGRGALEYLGLEDKKDNIIQMGTLSKALGGFGAFVCGSRTLIDYLINKSRSFIYTTALPPSVCAAAIKAVEIVESDRRLRARLADNIESFRRCLRALGFSVPCDPTPIIPLLTKDPYLTMELSRQLLEQGVYVQGIRPPSVPAGQSRLRLTLMATHRIEELHPALETIKDVANGLGLF